LSNGYLGKVIVERAISNIVFDITLGDDLIETSSGVDSYCACL